MITRKIATLVLAALAVPAASVTASASSPRQTVVVMHRDIKNVRDEAHWKDLALGLSSEGFRVVSVAMGKDEAPETASHNLIKLLDDSGFNQNVVLVGTAAASEALAQVAQAEPDRVSALVYISASDAVPAFGPRTVAEPESLQGRVQSYQVKVTNEKRTSAKMEGTAITFKIREEGVSTLGRIDDLVATIETVANLAHKTANFKS